MKFSGTFYVILILIFGCSNNKTIVKEYPVSPPPLPEEQIPVIEEKYNVKEGKEIYPAIIKPGVDVLLEKNLHLLKGKKVGLITNPTGITRRFVSTIDALHKHPEIELAALFGPEHGVRGDSWAGEKVKTSIDKITGVKIFSLYGKTKIPTTGMLKGIDILLYDIQDIGVRPYTYIYTLAYCMQAAAREHIPLIVLDRPNPLGGEIIDGNILNPEFRSFIGLYEIPYVYGMTVGELAGLFNEEYNINCDLRIILMEGWHRKMIFEDTKLAWIPTSPHIPYKETAFYCAITGCLGELNAVSIGVGYTMPFQIVGAPGINAEKLASELNGRNIPGLYFKPYYFKPYYAKHKDKYCGGVHIILENKRSVKPFSAGIHIMTAIRDLFPEIELFPEERVNSFKLASGTDKIFEFIKAGKTAAEILDWFKNDINMFKKTREKYILYN